MTLLEKLVALKDINYNDSLDTSDYAISKWMRNQAKIHIEVIYFPLINAFKVFIYDMNTINKKGKDYTKISFDDVKFKNYEDCLSYGVEQSFELYKQWRKK
ncbi:MAG: hypothetical protein RSE41_00205 [Clostridia bacterium]